MPTVMPRTLQGPSTPEAQAPEAHAKHLATTEAVGQPAPQEATPSDAPKSEEALSPKFAALARREKLLRAQAKQIEDSKKTFETERTQMRAQIEAEIKAQLVKDPFGQLQGAGLTFDQLTDLLMKQPKPEDQKLSSLEKEIQALKDAQTKSLEESRNQQTKQYQDAVAQIDKDVRSLVAAKPEEFENIQGDDAFDAVTSLIEQTYKEDKVLLTVEDAAKQVEDHLAGLYLERAKRASIQRRLSPPPEDAAEESAPRTVEATKPQAPTQKPQMTTLSNRNIAATAKPMTARERRERAILAFTGQLK